ncbi:hypothetical protein GCM10027169_20980 [Gordonia jinhuaensis]|uniref:HTH luxR-type domain-containing protein n=1 Tax=Gordonia jinhuaensis TaxID=1517702 RepID=A0A916THN4_9ACTN|nr:hypothetical protein GCM10011489_33770 [Gordonia jinhuaensis]
MTVTILSENTATGYLPARATIEAVSGGAAHRVSTPEQGRSQVQPTHQPHRAYVGRGGAGSTMGARERRTRRREEALLKLSRRTMPLPGVGSDGRGVDGRGLHLVPGAERRTDGPGCPGCSGARADQLRPRLSEREIEVLRTWLSVDTKGEVSELLFISLGTVNTHLTRIRVKYSEVGRPAPTKAALVARAIQDGIVDLDEL